MQVFNENYPVPETGRNGKRDYDQVIRKMYIVSNQVVPKPAEDFLKIYANQLTRLRLGHLLKAFRR